MPMLVPALLVSRALFVVSGLPSVDGAGMAALDEMVAINLDLPLDVQRMFEEMCELESISQSEMLTRWIDSRWEAMGYTDDDLAAYEATQVIEGGACRAGVGHCVGDRGVESSQGIAHSSDATEAKADPGDVESERHLVAASPALSVTSRGVSGARPAMHTSPSTASLSPRAESAPGTDQGRKGRPADGDSKPARGPPPVQTIRGSNQPARSDAIGRDAHRGAEKQLSSGQTTAGDRRESRRPGIPVVDEDVETEGEEEEEGMMDLDAWMKQRSEEDEGG